MSNAARLRANNSKKLTMAPPQQAGSQERLDARLDRAKAAARLMPLWKPLCLRHLRGQCDYEEKTSRKCRFFHYDGP